MMFKLSICLISLFATVSGGIFFSRFPFSSSPFSPFSSPPRSMSPFSAFSPFSSFSPFSTFSSSFDPFGAQQAAESITAQTMRNIEAARERNAEFAQRLAQSMPKPPVIKFPSFPQILSELESGDGKTGSTVIQTIQIEKPLGDGPAKVIETIKTTTPVEIKPVTSQNASSHGVSSQLNAILEKPVKEIIADKFDFPLVSEKIPISESGTQGQIVVSQVIPITEKDPAIQSDSNPNLSNSIQDISLGGLNSVSPVSIGTMGTNKPSDPTQFNSKPDPLVSIEEISIGKPTSSDSSQQSNTSVESTIPSSSQTSSLSGSSSSSQSSTESTPSATAIKESESSGNFDSKSNGDDVQLVSVSDSGSSVFNPVKSASSSIMVSNEQRSSGSPKLTNSQRATLIPTNNGPTQSSSNSKNIQQKFAHSSTFSGNSGSNSLGSNPVSSNGLVSSSSSKHQSSSGNSYFTQSSNNGDGTNKVYSVSYDSNNPGQATHSYSVKSYGT